MDFHQLICYYCGVGFDSFQSVLDHTCDFHGYMVLIVKGLELTITTGQFGYRSHNFGVFPFAIKNKQQIISVINDEPESLAITIFPQKGIGLVQNTFDDRCIKKSIDQKSKNK